MAKWTEDELAALGVDVHGLRARFVEMCADARKRHTLKNEAGKEYLHKTYAPPTGPLRAMVVKAINKPSIAQAFAAEAADDLIESIVKDIN